MAVASIQLTPEVMAVIPIPPYGLGGSWMVWTPWLVPIVLWWNSWH
nr:hypothetical protein JVH1_3874 [Rhodococcus sp. JVH1]